MIFTIFFWQSIAKITAGTTQFNANLIAKKENIPVKVKVFSMNIF